MITVIDTYAQIRALLAEGGFCMACWKRYAAAVSPRLPALIQDDIREYDFEKQILPVLHFLYAHEELLEEAHAAFVQVTDGLERKCHQAVAQRLDSRVVFYLGLCSGAGWAMELDGVPTVLLGVEKIVELHWTDPRSMAGLIYHELGHQWHFQNRQAPKEYGTVREKALWQLYSEGMAMYFEQRLCDDRHFYHQDHDGWLHWCRARREDLIREYLRRIDYGESVQGFFGDWCSYEGHSDTGYYLGTELVRRAADMYQPKELLNLSMAQVEMLLRTL